MSTATMALPFEAWCVDYYKAMAAVASVGQAVKHQASLVEIITDLWRVNRKFKSLLGDLNKLESAPVDQLKEMTANLRNLWSRVNSVQDLASKRGYTNRTFVNGAFYTLRQRNEELLDVIERFEISFDPSTSTALKDAKAEYERGEVTSLSTL